jgi:outer membrane beta-barrel protein
VNKQSIGIPVFQTILLLCMASMIFMLPGPTKAVCPEPLDTEGAGRKGIGKRQFQKSLRHEIDLLGGVYSNETMGIAPIAGIGYSFHLNEDFAIELDFAYAQFSSVLTNPLRSYTGLTLLPGHDARIYLGNLVWHPFYGKFMFFNSIIPHYDLYFIAGTGVTDSRMSKGLTYSIGAGIKIYCASWVSLRMELRDHIYVQEVLASESLTNNLSFWIGAGFWIPFES